MHLFLLGGDMQSYAIAVLLPYQANLVGRSSRTGAKPPPMVNKHGNIWQQLIIINLNTNHNLMISNVLIII